jgi:hypothetical protein
MICRAISGLLAVSMLCICLSASVADGQERAYGRVWGGAYGKRDYERFYHYPYVFYPQNFWGHEYYRSSEDMYYRYPQEMRIPVYNKKWQNYYPQGRLYHSGHHFVTDIF